MKEMIYLGGDHAGFFVKEKLKEFLEGKHIDYQDLGPYEYNEKDDYPDYAFKVGEKVAKNKGSRGILICGSGLGVSVAANKVKGIRAVSAYDEYSARMSRIDGDSNVLGLSGEHIHFLKIKRIVSIWLSTPFSKALRHSRRISKISKYESRK